MIKRIINGVKRYIEMGQIVKKSRQLCYSILFRKLTSRHFGEPLAAETADEKPLFTCQDILDYLKSKKREINNFQLKKKKNCNQF